MQVEIITYDLIKSFNPFKDPAAIGITNDYSDTVINFIKNYKNKFFGKHDILQFILREEFLTEKELMIFALKSCRRVQYITRDKRIAEALNVLEMYVNGKATKEELELARESVERDAREYDVHRAVYWATSAMLDRVRDVAYWSAHGYAGIEAQIKILLEILEEREINKL